MYRGDPEAIKWLDTAYYWRRVDKCQVWIGKGQAQEGYDYTRSRDGWTLSEICRNSMIDIKVDDNCDTPEYPTCSCYAYPNNQWSLGPMSPEQEQDWLKYENPGAELRDEWYRWWSQSNRENNLIREVVHEPV